MAISIYAANALLDHQLGKQPFVSPQVFVGLSSTAPSTAGANITEPTTGAYARAPTTGATWNSASGGATTNATAITFPTASADWLTGVDLTHGVLFDALIGGNMLGFAALPVPKNILSGDSAVIPINGISVTLS